MSNSGPPPHTVAAHRAALLLREEAETAYNCMHCDRRAAWHSDARKREYIAGADAVAAILADRDRLSGELDALRADKARLDWLSETGHQITPTFEPRDEAWRIVDLTLEQVMVHPPTVYAATLREAIDLTMPASLPSPTDHA